MRTFRYPGGLSRTKNLLMFDGVEMPDTDEEACEQTLVEGGEEAPGPEVYQKKLVKLTMQNEYGGRVEGSIPMLHRSF